MVKIVRFLRASLAAGAFFVMPWWAQADDACGPGWRLEAEKTAQLGLQLLHSGTASERVRLWRQLELGEDAPEGGRTDDFTSAWRGTWQEEKNANEYLTWEAITRGVSWTPKQLTRRSRLNVWFAAKLFEERRRLLGDDHPYLKQWLQNQQAVFAQTLAALVDASASYEGLAAELAADDIQYQRAALQFYGGEFAAAAEGFRAIAAQTASRYRSIAAYMLARSLVHDGRSEEAIAEIDAIEKNPALADVRLIAQQLYGVISWDARYSGNDVPGTVDAARRLLLANAQALRLPLSMLQADSGARAQYWQAIYDLAFFLRSDASRSWRRGEFDDDWWLDGTRAKFAGIRASAVGPAAKEDDLVDWLEATEQVRMLARGPWLGFWSTRASSDLFQAASDHVRQRAEQTGRLSWAIADAMRSVNPSDAAESALAGIEGKLADCSAGYAELLALGPLRYHLTRGEVAGGSPGYYGWNLRGAADDRLANLDPAIRLEAIRFSLAFSGTLDNFPGPSGQESGIDRLLSRTLGEFLAARGKYDYSGDEAAVISMLPVRVLLQLAGDETLPEQYRASLARNAWTRAFLLQDESLLRPASDLLAKLNPALSGLVTVYRNAWTETGRKRAALWLLLRAPSMQIFTPSSGDVGFGYYQRGGGNIAPGKWSWFLSPAEFFQGSDLPVLGRRLESQRRQLVVPSGRRALAGADGEGFLRPAARHRSG